jgi:hypothetical protein
MIGQKISPILVELEAALIEYEIYNGSQPNYTIEGFRAATKIFMSVLLDKMYNLQCNENLDTDDKLNMAHSAGIALKDLVKTYTDIDTTKLYA